MTMNFEKFDFTTEENIKIEQLAKLVKDCQSLQIGTEIEILGRYLFCNDWDVEKAYHHIHEYYDFKNKHPDWITSNQTPEDFEDIINLQTRILMPHTDKNGKFIIIHKSVDAFDKIPNYTIKLIELDDLIYEAILSSPRGQKYGMTTIMDTAGINKNYLKYVTPSIATLIGKKCEVMPIRIQDKKGHFILRGLVVNTIISIILPFFGNLRKLAIFHKSTNLEKLKEYVGKEYLPYEYGGPDNNIFDSSYLKEFLQCRYKYVAKSQKYFKKK